MVDVSVCAAASNNVLQIFGEHNFCHCYQCLLFHSHLDPSLPIGRRKEIDNVMKKARANTNDYWDKKLLEVEEKDPNRWRHTGYKKMYIEGESSSDSDRDSFRYNRVLNQPCILIHTINHDTRWL